MGRPAVEVKRRPTVGPLKTIRRDLDAIDQAGYRMKWARDNDRGARRWWVGL